jgi:hypothetical protein
LKTLRNPYLLLGVGLLLAGIPFALVAYFLLDSVQLTALGLAMAILGAVSFALGQALPAISPEVALVLLEAGWKNIASLVEELGIRTQAIYLPSLLSGGSPQAIIPLQVNPSLHGISRNLPRRLIVKYGPGAEDMGILVSTPGSVAIRLGDGKLGPQAALSAALVGALDVADSITVEAEEKSVRVRIARPRLDSNGGLVVETLGTYLASIVACFVAEALNQPVRITDEHEEGKEHVVELEVLLADI